MATLVTAETDLFHICTTPLEAGAIINPGGRGRMIRMLDWRHGDAVREAALERSRLAKAPHLPSRLNAAFAFLTRNEAEEFMKRNQSVFGLHFIYRVRLVDPSAPSHVTDWRLNMPLGAFRVDWADVYWVPWDTHTATIPGINVAAEGYGRLREFLTLSQLRVEERLN